MSTPAGPSPCLGIKLINAHVPLTLRSSSLGGLAGDSPGTLDDLGTSKRKEDVL